MPMSTSSSISRPRPAVLVLAAAAAACAAYLVYTSFSSSPPDRLHRSNAVRRPNNRPRARTRAGALDAARVAQQLQPDPAPLGEFDFFGHTIALHEGNMMSYTDLQELGHRLQPDASEEAVTSRIMELFDTLTQRVLNVQLARRGMPELTNAELESILQTLREQMADRNAAQTLETHRGAFLRNADSPPADDLESILATEAGDIDAELEGDVEGHTLQRTLYHIAEDRARHEGVVHRGITCNGCETRPIRGIRWHCANCADFDLCSDCEATNTHVKTHIFYKIRVPAPNLSISKQEPLYPGRPHMLNPSVDAHIKKDLIKNTRMEAEEIEALWDQFTCLATTSWTTDPNGIGWALDRRAFNHAFIPRYSTFKSAPNLIYDRVFSYFDTDHNTLIGFEEFVKGIDGLHSTDVHVKLRIVFNGYDVDGDGYISRKDVLRIFRAHYAIEREATRNYLAESAEEMSVRGALDVIQSAQPLGSAFTQGAIEPGEPNWLLRGKPSDEEVDVPPIVGNQTDTLDRETIIASTHPCRNDEDGQRVVESALRDRWARRQFYTDEEEGFVRPEGADDGPHSTAFGERPNGFQNEEAHENAENEPPTPELERPRWSRSSSRVRFQDDIDIETRSNASTSSRPVGERWGGYEVPEPEKDLGQEVLYQITQQAFNELLDPLFKAGEDAAMDAYSTREERRSRVAEIDAILDKFNTERDLLKRILSVGIFTYANCVVKAFCSSDFTIFAAKAPLVREEVATIVHGYFTPAESSILPLTDPWDTDWQPEEDRLWVIMMFRAQLEHELVQAMTVLAAREGWVPAPESSPSLESSPLTPAAEDSHGGPVVVDRDPTFPQFRPNSLSDMAITSPASTSSESSDEEGATSPFGPLFVIPCRSGDSASNLSDAQPATEVGTAPYVLPDLGITLSRPIPMSDSPLAHPAMHILSLSPGPAPTLRDEFRLLSQHPAFDSSADVDSTFNNAITNHAYAMGNANPHLRDVALARLEAVDRRDAERKGSGKISFGEFERAAREGRMRFLESWMDWVSF